MGGIADEIFGLDYPDADGNGKIFFTFIRNPRISGKGGSEKVSLFFVYYGRKPFVLLY